MSEKRKAVSRCHGFRDVGCPPPNQAAHITVRLIIQNGRTVVDVFPEVLAHLDRVSA